MHYVLRIRRPIDQPAGHGEERRRVPPVQLPERRGIARAAHPLGQLAIGRGVGRRRDHGVAAVATGTKSVISSVRLARGVPSSVTMPTFISGCAGSPSARLVRYG